MRVSDKYREGFAITDSRVITIQDTLSIRRSTTFRSVCQPAATPVGKVTKDIYGRERLCTEMKPRLYRLKLANK